MPSRILLSVSSESTPGCSKAVDVAEGFEATIEKVFPVRNTSMSAEEERTRQLFRLEDGRRVLIHPGNIFLIEELDPNA